MMNKSIFDFSADSDGIVIIATHPSAYYLIETLRQNTYSGQIILVEDMNRPLSLLPEKWINSRLTVHPSSIDEIIPLIESLKSPLGCVISWYQIFNKKLIDAFNSRILNVHTGDLPNYRGAGGGSWQVLNNEKKIVSHVQQMLVQVDRGPILFGEEEPLPDKAYPLDVKQAGKNAMERLLKRLGLAIINKEIVELLAQEEENASYFPRLNTSLDGWIDFSWSVDQVERFIRAFSYPYPGAAFSYMGITYRAKQSRKRQCSVDFHPFCNGFIVNKDHNSLHVVCSGGVICLTEIFDIDENPVSLKKFKLGKNISPDFEILRKAKDSVIDHPGLI
jgi:methionyl-tRNA formyltransferase